jgi:hypothetical protein
MNLAQLQLEVSLWSQKNFPNNKPYHPLLGVSEEVGELCHAHLKLEQGIRGTSAELGLAKIDAVGDIIIYLADYCGRNGISLDNAVTTAWDEVKNRDWQKNKEKGV